MYFILLAFIGSGMIFKKGTSITAKPRQKGSDKKLKKVLGKKQELGLLSIMKFVTKRYS